MLLPLAFYLRPDVVTIARDLLGKYLCTRIDGQYTSGMICETEAYEGETDRASHAWNGRRTERTEVMYAVGGTAYVYLCYGVHSLFNVVSNAQGIPHAILVRGIIPSEGLEIMVTRSGKENIPENFGIGPGKVSKILGIHYTHTGTDLTRTTGDPAIWIEDRGVNIDPHRIQTGTRIGVDYAGKDALLPYRFRVEIDEG
jgi:DNA-3-methyladenine glycosylase